MQLPGCQSASELELDVDTESISLTLPGKYHLEAKLPFPVKEDKGRASFDKARQQLEVVLPVIPPPMPPRQTTATAADPDSNTSASFCSNASAAAAAADTSSVEAAAVTPATAATDAESAAQADGTLAGMPKSEAVGAHLVATPTLASADPSPAKAPANAAAAADAQHAAVATTGQAAAPVADTDGMTQNERKWHQMHQQRQHSGLDSTQQPATDAAAELEGSQSCTAACSSQEYLEPPAVAGISAEALRSASAAGRDCICCLQILNWHNTCQSCGCTRCPKCQPTVVTEDLLHYYNVLPATRLTLLTCRSPC